MNSDENKTSQSQKQKITVEAEDIDGIIDALRLNVVDSSSVQQPDELTAVTETLAAIYEGVRTATEQDSRGRSRKMIREYAGRDDLSSEAVGHVLRVLEAHDLVVQDGNRWRIAAAD